LAYLLPETVGTVLFAVPLVLLPAAAGIATLRYRLYDIDRLINRTLVYGLLTALLAGVYASVVLVLGQVFGGVGRGTPSWAVASATLAVAAPFQPARRRIQQSWIGASTGAATMPPRPSRRTASACATRSTSTPSPPSCWRSWTRPCSRPGSRSGFDLPHPAPQAQLTTRHGLLPGLLSITSGLCLRLFERQNTSATGR
jgi:hypothetical protein